MIFNDICWNNIFGTPRIKFRTKINGRDTPAVVPLTGWMDLATLVAAHRRETARVLGLQGAPAESDIDPKSFKMVTLN